MSRLQKDNRVIFKSTKTNIGWPPTPSNLQFVPLCSVSQFGCPESSAHPAASGAHRSPPRLHPSAPPQWMEASWTTLDTFHGYLERSGKSLCKVNWRVLIFKRGGHENIITHTHVKEQECRKNWIRKTANWNKLNKAQAYSDTHLWKSWLVCLMKGLQVCIILICHFFVL